MKFNFDEMYFCMATYVFGIIAKKTLLNSRSKFYLQFLVRDIVLALKFRSPLIFVWDLEVGVQFHSSACGYPRVPAPFVKETILPPHWIVSASLSKSVDFKSRIYFWTLTSVPFITTSYTLLSEGCEADGFFWSVFILPMLCY